MLVQIFEKQEEMKAKKQYKNNISKIYDLEDICKTIEELIQRIEDVGCEYKDSFAEELKGRELEIINEIQWYEEQNLEIKEIYEEESEEW